MTTVDPVEITYTEAFAAGHYCGRSDTLADMANEVEGLNRDKGWYDQQRTFGDEIALLHSEVSEALDAWREVGFNERTDDTKAYAEGIGKPDDVASELADVFIRLLDTCKRHDIDLHAEFARKMRYNRTRPYRHGGRAI